MTKTRIIRLLNKPDNKKCTLFSLKKKYANILCWKSFYFYFVFFFFNNSFLFVQRFYPQINFSLVIWKIISILVFKKLFMVFNMYRCFQMLIHLFTVTLVKVDITVHLYFTDEKLRHGQLNAMDQYFRELKFLLCSLDQRPALCLYPPFQPPLLAYHLLIPSLLTDLHPESLQISETYLSIIQQRTLKTKGEKINYTIMMFFNFNRLKCLL